MSKLGLIAKLKIILNDPKPATADIAATDIGTDISYEVSVPIGSIVAWHKTFANTPALPDGWVECDGSVLSDGDSVYDGQTIPDLNGETRFLRGGAVSGTEQGQALEEHSHTFSAVYNITGSGFASRIPEHAAAGNDTGTFVVSTTSWTTGGADTDANETRPINMSVVWIIRVK